MMTSRQIERLGMLGLMAIGIGWLAVENRGLKKDLREVREEVRELQKAAITVSMALAGAE